MRGGFFLFSPGLAFEGGNATFVILGCNSGREGAMAEDVLFRADNVEITPSVARLQNISYQIANIGSVWTTHTRTMNQNALGLIILSIILFLVAYIVRQGPYAEYDLLTAIFAGAVFVAGMVLQNKRPVITYFLSFKTASGDIQALASRDYDYIMKVKEAIERAFSLRA
jgi:hypothetical protein